MGPVAFYILRNADITVYKASPLDVRKNLKLLNEGKLKEVTSLSSGYP
jgi:predicted Fe-Mo cluster-binding NifX family protein